MQQLFKGFADKLVEKFLQSLPDMDEPNKRLIEKEVPTHVKNLFTGLDRVTSMPPQEMAMCTDESGEPKYRVVNWSDKQQLRDLPEILVTLIQAKTGTIKRYDHLTIHTDPDNLLAGCITLSIPKYGANTYFVDIGVLYGKVTDYGVLVYVGFTFISPDHPDPSYTFNLFHEFLRPYECCPTGPSLLDLIKLALS